MKEYQYGRWNATWIPSSSWTSILDGEQTAPNNPASCRGCLHMPRSWDAKNMNILSVEATSNQFLGRTLRQKHWPSRWWDSRPPRRMTRGSTTKYTNRGGCWGPHHMGQSGWESLDREICNSLEEQMQQRLGTTRPEGLEGAFASIIQPS